LRCVDWARKWSHRVNEVVWFWFARKDILIGSGLSGVTSRRVSSFIFEKAGAVVNASEDSKWEALAIHLTTRYETCFQESPI